MPAALFSSSSTWCGASFNSWGIAISGTLDDLLDEADIVVDCTP